MRTSQEQHDTLLCSGRVKGQWVGQTHCLDKRDHPRHLVLNWKTAPTGEREWGGYTIRQDGFHDSGRQLGKWLLFYRGTLVHTNDPLKGSGIADCMKAADRHRGVSNP